MSVFNQKMSVLVLDLHVYGHCLLTFISFGWDVQHQTVKTLIRLYMHLRVIHFISITVWMNFQTGVLKPNNEWGHRGPFNSVLDRSWFCDQGSESRRRASHCFLVTSTAQAGILGPDFRYVICMNKQLNCKVCLRSQVSIGKKCSKECLWRKMPQESTLENLTQIPKLLSLGKGNSIEMWLIFGIVLLRQMYDFQILNRNTEANGARLSLALAQLNKSRKQRSWSTWLGEGHERLEMLWKCLSPILTGKQSVTDFVVQINAYLVFYFGAGFADGRSRGSMISFNCWAYQSRHVHTKAKIAEKFGNKAQMG